WRGRRDPRGHHEGHVVRWLSQGVEHGTKGFGELERERFLVDGRDLTRVSHEELAEAILPSPALERLYTVLGADRLPVVPLEPVAQREGVLHAVRRHGELIDHLRLDP